MATPYFQLRQKSVPSTQDVAREALSSPPAERGGQAAQPGEGGQPPSASLHSAGPPLKGGTIPVLVIASRQTEGRGRKGAPWVTADRALAASFAFLADRDESRPISLMAGVAAARAGVEITLKWPNDLMASEAKVGGILVERTDDVVVVGLGLNLWWREAPQGMAGLWDDDPGPERHVELGALWGAELAALLEERAWPRQEYLRLCSTLGREITWEPEGSGKAVDVDHSGALIVEDEEDELLTITSGAVRHVRLNPDT